MKRKANSLPNDSLMLTGEDLNNQIDSDSEISDTTKRRKVKSDDELSDDADDDEFDYEETSVNDEGEDVELIQEDGTVDNSKVVDTILKLENRRITVFTKLNKIVELINNQQTRSEYGITDEMLTQHADRIKNKYLVEENVSKDPISYEETDLNIDIHSGLYPEESNLSLYKYQKEGIVWLLKNYFDRNNVILADDMGVGKTVQVVSTINYLIKYMKIKGPFLIVVPLSVLTTWEKEFKSWKLDHIEVLTYHGSLTRKRALEKYCIFSDDAHGRYLYPNVIITTKECVGKQLLLSKIFWKYVVVDEAHFLSDTKRKLYKKMSNLNTDAFLLLTGTPFQNNLKEFHSLITFLKRESGFGSFKEFKRMCQEEESKFGKMIKNIMMRRTKESVLAGVIKPKEEYFLVLEPTPLQIETFEEVRNRYEKDDALAYLSDSIKVANHPFIYLLDQYSTAPYSTLGDDGDVHDPIYSSRFYKKFLSTISCREHLISKIINSSSKLIVLDYLLEKHYGEGNKVVIFSQYTTTMDFLEYYLLLRDYKYQRFDGSSSKSERTEAVESFQHENSQDFVLLLSTKAGGVGLNLVSANVVIEYDITWNPHADEQATNRCHRIGQTKTVYVYKFLIQKSIEDLVLKYTQEKLAMSTRVNSNVTQNSIEYDYYNMNILSKLKQKELKSILQKKKHKDYYSVSTLIRHSWTEHDYKKHFINLSIHNVFEWYSNQHVEMLIDIFRNYPSEAYILKELKQNDDWSRLKSLYKNEFLLEKLNELSNLINENTGECSFYTFTLNVQDFKVREFDLLLTISKYYSDEQFEKAINDGCDNHSVFLNSLKPLYTVDDIEIRFQEELKNIVKEIGELIGDAEIEEFDYLTKLTKSLKELNTTISELFNAPYHQKQIWEYIQTKLGIGDLRETCTKLQSFLIEEEERKKKEEEKKEAQKKQQDKAITTKQGTNNNNKNIKSNKVSSSTQPTNNNASNSSSTSKKKVVSSGGSSLFKNKRR